MQDRVISTPFGLQLQVTSLEASLIVLEVCCQRKASYNLLSLTQGDPIPVLRLAPYLALAPHQMIQLTKLAEHLERKFILNHALWWDKSQKNT